LYKTDQISTKLTRAFKGYIYRGYIQTVCGRVNPKWLRTYTKQSPFSKHENTKKGLSAEPLTQQEQDYVQAHKDEIERDQRVMDLIQFWTGKNLEEQGAVKQRTAKGASEDRALVEASKDYMLKISKQMTDSTVIWTINSLRTLVTVANAFSDILYEEQELRERNKGLRSA